MKGVIYILKDNSQHNLTKIVTVSVSWNFYTAYIPGVTGVSAI